MAKTCAELIAAVRARAARSNDTVLITADFVLLALNEGQIHIARKMPRQIDLDSSSTEDYQISTDDTSIDLTTITPAHIGGIWILNEGATRQAGIKYRSLEDFRKEYVPVSEEGSGEWTEYTRQGNTLLFNCPLASDYDELYLRIDYTKWAAAFASTTSTATSDLSNSDKGLILFALAEVYDEIALSQPKFEAKALKLSLIHI